MDAESVLHDDDLVYLRSNLEDGLATVHHRGADRRATARLLELYAEAVREGYERPSGRRGRWWRRAHGGEQVG